MSPRKKRIFVICIVLSGITISVALILTAFEKNLMYFYSPTEGANGSAPEVRDFRIGGIVLKDSVKRNVDNLKVSFVLTDTVSEIEVQYEGILPDLFREGQGVVIEGKLVKENIIHASTVFAKHDENYMPESIKKELEKNQIWQKNYK